MMAANLTKDELEKLLQEQTNSILSAVDHKFARLEARLTREHDEVIKSIKGLTATLDRFFLRLTEHEVKVNILYNKVEKITSFIKDKFGVEITA